jgi:hypothetical protein
MAVDPGNKSWAQANDKAGNIHADIRILFRHPRIHHHIGFDEKTGLRVWINDHRNRPGPLNVGNIFETVRSASLHVLYGDFSLGDGAGKRNFSADGKWKLSFRHPYKKACPVEPENGPTRQVAAAEHKNADGH